MYIYVYILKKHASNEVPRFFQVLFGYSLPVTILPKKSPAIQGAASICSFGLLRLAACRRLVGGHAIGKPIEKESKEVHPCLMYKQTIQGANKNKTC